MRGQWQFRLGPGMRGALFYLFFWGVAGMYIPFINVHFLRLGFSGKEIGLIATLAPLFTFLVAPLLSTLADRRTWRVALLTWSILGLSLVLMLLSQVHTFGLAVLLMACLALARCSIAPIGDSLVVRMAVRYGIAYGKLRLWGSFGFAVIAIACGAVWQRIGFTPMFLISGVLFTSVALIAALLEEMPAPRRNKQQPVAMPWRDGGLVAILGASFLIGGALSMAGTFEGVYMARLGGSDFLVGVIFGLSAFSEMPAMFFGDVIVRRLGSTSTLLLAYALLAIGYAGYALATAPWMLLLLVPIKGMGFGLYFTSTVRLLDARVSPQQAATIQGVMNATAGGLAPLLAGPLSGTIYDAHGPAAVFATCSALIVCGGCFLGLVASRGQARSMARS